MYPIGIFLNFWENNWKADIRKYIKKASKLGFDVLEFQAQALLDMTKQERMGLKKYADENSIELTYSLGLDMAYDVSSMDEKTRLGGIEYLKNIMQCMYEMNGRIISGVSYAGWGVPKGDFDKQKLRENSIKSLQTLSKLAEEMDIIYGIEAVNRFEGVIVNTAKEAVSYVKEVDSKNVGILLDTYHMNIEEFSIGDAIRTAGDHLVGFHIGENNRSVPGRGHLNWDEIFKALKDINYSGRIVAEPFVVMGGEVGRDIFVWRDLVNAVDEGTLDAEAEFMLDFIKSKI